MQSSRSLYIYFGQDREELLWSPAQPSEKFILYEFLELEIC